MMLFHYPFMLPAIVICLIFAGIHTYFGYHIVERGVIFADLALAQIAALGSSVALVLGWGENAPAQSYLISLGFTFGGAVLFAFFRTSRGKVPIEALIGITYAAAIALSLLVLEKSAEGTEHIKEMLVGAILTVSWREVSVIGLVILATGIIHVLARRRLFLISEHPEEAENKGIRLWWWDLVFYATFGIAVTLSVRVAGVLLVFSLLIIPAVSAVLCFSGTARRVIFGWVMGIAGCLLGLELSLRADLAAGPSIITALLSLLLVSGGISWTWRRRA